MMIPGVRAAFSLAEEKRIDAAFFQGRGLELQARIDALEAERAELQRAKDNAYKLVVNVFSQYAWGVKQFAEVGGMPEQFHPQEGVMPSESVNASSLLGRRNKQAMDEMEEYFKERS
jgi:hypothetical protein